MRCYNFYRNLGDACLWLLICFWRCWLQVTSISSWFSSFKNNLLMLYYCADWFFFQSVSLRKWSSSESKKSRDALRSVGEWRKFTNVEMISRFCLCMDNVLNLFLIRIKKIMKKCQKFMNKFLELDFMRRWRFSIFFHIVRLTRHRVRFCAILLFCNIKWHHHYLDPCEWIAAIDNWA